MISCCANQNCSARHFDSACGRTYCAKGPSGIEFFWLCPKCAPHYELSLDSGKRPHLHPRPETGRMSLIKLSPTENPTHTTF
jgi:hypothetical protein